MNELKLNLELGALDGRLALSELKYERTRANNRRLRDALERVLEIMEDEYDGAEDSGNRYWGSAILAGKSALLLKEEK